jgi:hypothetical protein
LTSRSDAAITPPRVLARARTLERPIVFDPLDLLRIDAVEKSAISSTDASRTP